MRPSPGRARATTSASTRPMRSAASPSRRRSRTPPRSWNPGPWPRSRRRRRPIGRSPAADDRWRGPGLRRPAGDGDLCRRSPRQHPAGLVDRSARRRTRSMLVEGRPSGRRVGSARASSSATAPAAARAARSPASSPTTWPRAAHGRSGCRRTTPCWRTPGATGAPSAAPPPTSRPQSAWKQADAIRMDRGILFTTYATLRQPARGDRPSRLDQIVTWLGADFDGVIVFDEAHAMANAAGGGKGARGAEEGLAAGHGGPGPAEPPAQRPDPLCLGHGRDDAGEPRLRRAAGPLGRARSPLPYPRGLHGRRARPAGWR